MSNARNLAALALQPMAFKNKLINGAFDVWQRGTSFNGLSTGYYGPDRWQVYRGGAVAGATFSRVAYNGPNALYALRAQRDSGNTSTASINVATSLETIDAYMLKGKTVTLSFRYLTGANFSGSTFNVSMVSGTGVDGSIANGFTNGASFGSLSSNPSTTQQYATLTLTVPSNASQFGISFGYNPTGTAGANDYFEITNIQLEIGSVATPFEYRPYPVELLMCQRYYEKTFYRVDAAAASAAFFASTTVPFKATKRTVPTLTRQNENLTNIAWNSWQVDLNSAVPIYSTAANAGSATANMVAEAEL